jgi:hypothetical protein
LGDCDGCIYFKADRGDGYFGECRRRAPLPARETDREQEQIRFATWPLVRAEDACGEHMPAKAPGVAQDASGVVGRGGKG